MVAPAYLTTYYDLAIRPSEGYSDDPTPLMAADERAAGPMFGAIVSRVDPRTWALSWPRGADWPTVWQLLEAWQRTGKGVLPMTWTPPEGTEEVVVFQMTALTVRPLTAARYEIGDVVLGRWHG